MSKEGPIYSRALVPKKIGFIKIIVAIVAIFAVITLIIKFAL